MKLTGKVAVVTGAGRGVGRGEALLLAAAGATVIVNDLGGESDGTGRGERPAQQVVDEIVEAGGQAIADHEDIADWDGGRRTIERATDRFGRLDILVCNAGILRDRMVFNMTEQDWDAVIRVHLKGHFVPTHFAARYWRDMFKTSGKPVDASVVFTTSGSGLYGNAGQSNYAAAKAGIASFGIVAARELARYGVRVNIISPSAETRLTERLAHSADPGGNDPAVDPSSIAPWVAFLSSDAAKHISGQTFGVRGGVVELLKGWHPHSRIEKPGRWELAELDDAARSLFEGQSSAPPPLPF